MNKINIEGLLTPRFEVIADYPNRTFLIGEIIQGIENKQGTFKKVDDYYILLDRYPHLFKKLQWFEKRKLEEMPKILKCIYSKHINEKPTFHKIETWLFDGKNMCFRVKNEWVTLIESLDFAYVPCSEEEYLQNLK